MNLNAEKARYPGIDLGDTEAGIGFQVTATKTSQKVVSTLETFVKHECYKKYPSIKFFILTEKLNSYSIKNFNTHIKIEFNPEKDILDFDSLYIRSMYLDLSEQKEVVEYIHQQLPYVSESIGVDYYSPITYKRLVHEFKEDDWLDGQITIEHNFGYLPQVSVMMADGREALLGITRTEKCICLAASMKFAGKALLT